MSLLTATDLAKSFGAEDLFSGLSLEVARGARLAIVGPNGIGKTTLLRILVGEEEPTAGRVTRARGLRIGYLPQEAHFTAQSTLWETCLEPFRELRAMQEELHRLETRMADPAQADEALARYGKLQEAFERRGGYTYPTRIRQVLNGLGFDEADFDLPVHHLSGGQRTRAYLARLLLSDPDLLLLDEPTNHLDIAAVEWLEGYLSRWEGAAIIVSHDRYFIDRVANGILEMSADGLETYRGNYTHYLRQRQERWERRREVFERQKAELLKEVEYIKKNIAGQNTSQAKGRLRRLTRLVQAIEQVGLETALSTPWSRLGVETTTSPFSVAEAERRVRALRLPDSRPPRLHLRLRTAERSGDLVLRTRDLRIGYPKRPLFHAPDIELRRGECAALIGPNGTGKTTFLKTILGQVPPLEGEVVLGDSLRIGYFAQAHEGLDPGRTLMEEIESVAPAMLPGQIRDYLGKFLFSGDDVFKRVESLSGGERGRLALAKLALQDTNFLLLDEPTNHLDIPSQEILQAVLSEYPGTILLVSHDRYLIDALATQVWEIHPDEARLTVFKGTYSELRAAREAEAARRAAQAEKTPGKRRAGRGSGSDATARAERRRVARLQEVENQIVALERRLAEIGRQLEGLTGDPAEVARLGQEYAEVQRQIDEKLDEWERLQKQSAAETEGHTTGS